MRRSARWIVVGFALGIFGCSSAKAPALQPLGDAMPSGVAIIIPDNPAASGNGPGGTPPRVASAQSASGRVNPKRSGSEGQDEASPWNTPPRPALPRVRVEPPIGVTVMRLVPDDNSLSAVPVSAGAVAQSGPPHSGAHTISVSSHGASPSAAPAAGSAGQSAGTGRASAADSAAPASSRVAASTTNGTQISFSVGDAHPNGASAAGAGGSGAQSTGASPPKCAVRILKKKPKDAARKVATFKLKGAARDRDAIMALLKRRACEAGANALLIKKSTESAGASTYHVEATALALKSAKSAADGKPVPKTIEVPPPSPPVPKTITVDPGASP